MSVKSPTWLVPIAADVSPDVRGPYTATVHIDGRLRVALGADRPGGPLLVMTPMESAQLGQALLDASREAGARKAKAKR